MCVGLMSQTCNGVNGTRVLNKNQASNAGPTKEYGVRGVCLAGSWRGQDFQDAVIVEPSEPSAGACHNDGSRLQ